MKSAHTRERQLQRELKNNGFETVRAQLEDIQERYQGEIGCARAERYLFGEQSMKKAFATKSSYATGEEIHEKELSENSPTMHYRFIRCFL